MALSAAKTVPIAFILLIASLISPSLQFYGATTNFTEWFEVVDFPQEQTENVTKYLYEAKKVAGDDLASFFEHRCMYTASVYPELGALAQADGFVAPSRPFDSLFFIGESYVSSWAIDTGAGLVVIDTLDNPDEVERVLIPGLQYFGYDGADITAIIITHEHGDHYGGAKYLQDNFGTPIYASDVAWEGMANDPIKPEGLIQPMRNMTIKDGQDLTIGNTTIHIVTTPGHTPGTVSLLFDVYDRGVPHTVALYGGGGIPADEDAKDAQIQSFAKFAKVSALHRADVLLSNHQSQDNSLSKFDLLKYRPCGECGCEEPNPFVVGTETYLRYLETMSLCVRVKAARDGHFLTV